MTKKGKRARQKAKAAALAAAPINQVIILRGPSGSGKSTLARNITDDAQENGLSTATHSTDDYFLDTSGNYLFVPEKLQEYHAKNRAAFQQSLKNGVNVVVIDNTNILKVHYSQYWILARQYGYEVIEKTPETEWLFDPEGCRSHCTKNIDLYVIQRQITQFERF